MQFSGTKITVLKPQIPAEIGISPSNAISEIGGLSLEIEKPEELQPIRGAPFGGWLFKHL